MFSALWVFCAAGWFSFLIVGGVLFFREDERKAALCFAAASAFGIGCIFLSLMPSGA